MSDESKVALVEALSKLGLGTLLAGILAAVIWFNHTEQGIISDIMKHNNTNMEKSNDLQVKLLMAMESNQEISLELFRKHIKQMEETGKVLEHAVESK